MNVSIKTPHSYVRYILAWSLLLHGVSHGIGQGESEGLMPVCNKNNAPNHMIYCHGPILEAVMAFKLYPDSKTFVDKPLRYKPEVVLENFHRAFPSGNGFSHNTLTTFIADNFFEEGTDMRSCKLEDWTENPLRLASISDKSLRSWALELNYVWKSLCREVDPAVRNESERFSLLYVPNRFIVPGGRFREYYYWDSYWSIKGLLASGMYNTAKGMLTNFIYIVEKYGFVPNGGRVYYLTRSQPPLLTAMVYEYYEVTHDIDFLKNAVSKLEKELFFWETNRKVRCHINGTAYEMYQYRADSNSPRSESFREDVMLVKQFTKETQKHRVWQDIASAAESGWDFSSRWFRSATDMSTIETTNIIPVDLNSILCWNMNILSYFFDEIADQKKAEEFRDRLGKFRIQFQKVFYVKNESGWFDFNVRTQTHNIQYYASMATPLFTRCYHSLNQKQAERIFDKMEEKGAFKYIGGIPTSLTENTNQQWDFPNGWSPLNHMVIEGLRKSESARMQYKAFQLAQKWILSNYRVFKKTGVMWEKYDVIGTSPNAGSGGEYSVQAGFGWTNGVILDLLVTYGEQLSYAAISSQEDQNDTHLAKEPLTSTNRMHPRELHFPKKAGKESPNEFSHQRKNIPRQRSRVL